MAKSFRRYFRKRNSSSDNHLQKREQARDNSFIKAPGKDNFIHSLNPFIQKKEAKEEDKAVQLKDSPTGADRTPFVPPLEGRGTRLPADTSQFFSQKMGYDFSKVKVHTGRTASDSAKSLGARAYTIKENIVFKEGEYQPETTSGKKLIAHELTHVIQQSSGSKSQIQRDLSAYNKAHTEYSLSPDPYSSSQSYWQMSAEASGIRSALDQLIKDDKVKEVKSSSGNKSWFAANHHKNVQLSEIENAFSNAGYAEAKKMAKALYDIHSEYFYSDNKFITHTMFKTFSSSSKNKLNRETSRSMTEYEIRQAKRVFKSAIDYSKVKIEENSNFMAAFGYARTIGNSIYFPDDSYRSMSFMIHELTHVWQYQRKGWKYAPIALKDQVMEGYSYTPKGKTVDEALTDARNAGKTLYDFNLEQQGDILSDYFIRLQNGQDVIAFQPFVNDVK